MLGLRILQITLPFGGPQPVFGGLVAVFAVAIVVFLFARLLLKPFQLPGIIGILLIGVLIGPNVLHIIDRGRAIRLLGMIGLLYFLFTSGLEIDLSDALENPTRITIFAGLTFLLPLTLGTAGGVVVLGFSFLPAILFASMFSSHTPLSYSSLERLDLLKNNAVTTTVGVALITDTAALLILAAIEKLHSEGSQSLIYWAQFIFKLVIFFVGVWVIVSKVGRWFFRTIDDESSLGFLFTFAVVLVSAYLATLAGADPIIGAFLAGVTLNRLVPSTGTLVTRIQFMGNALFIPFFFLSIGMLVDPWVFFQSLQPWIMLGVMLGVMVTMKLTAAVATGRIYDFERYEWLTMFGISTGQGPAAIAIALIGVESGLFTQTLLNAVVVLIILSGILSPYLAEKFGREVIEGEEDQDYDPSDAPQRILIPLTQYTDNAESLLDLAMVLHESGSEEPIRALTVVQREDQELDVSDRYTGSNQSEADDDSDEQQADEQAQEEQEDEQQTEEEVAEAEESLEETEEQAISADVPIETQTRVVETSTVDGITQDIEDNRITSVIIGWDDQRRFGQRLFGSTTDQLLQQTNELVLVANLAQPINTTDRIVVVLPGRISVHPGFHEGIHTVQLAAEEMGISVQYFLIEGDQDQYESRIGDVEPEVPFEIDTVESWSEFDSAGEERFEDGDFVIALTPREGARGWDAHLSDLPEQLAATAPDNVGIVYLPEEGKARSRRVLES